MYTNVYMFMWMCISVNTSIFVWVYIFLPELQEHVRPGKRVVFFTLVTDRRQQRAIGRGSLVNVDVMRTAVAEITE